MNEKRFLSEAVESITRQEYTNWEIILVDDGSTDGSTEIAKKLAADNPGKIIYTDHPNHINRGLSASRNVALALAKGEFVAILDADDVWLTVKLRLQVDVMNANPAVGMLCEASEYWYSWSGPGAAKEDTIIKIGDEQNKVFYPPHLAETLYPLGKGAAPCPSGIIFRKDPLEKHSGFEAQFTGKNQMYEDQAFLTKFYLNEPVYISSMCNNRYRQREGSLVQKVRVSGDYASVRKYFLDWLRRYLAEHHIEFKHVNRLLKLALEPYEQPILHNIKTFFNRITRRLTKFQG